MTSIDDLTAEVMKGLSEYAELTDKAMKKAVRKTATAVKNEISAKAPVKERSISKKNANMNLYLFDKAILFFTIPLPFIS